MNILKFLSKKTKKELTPYLSCKFLNHGISFMHTAIKTCCHSKEGITFYKDYSGEKINWKAIEETRKKAIENCKNGIIPKTCEGCINLEKANWGNDKIKEIIINNWDHCNCGCIYCVYSSHGTYLQTEKQPSKYYNVYKHLKWLYQHKKISKQAKIIFVGGDLTLLDETDKIIDLCLKNKVGLFFFHTSAIFYSQGIEKALKSNQMVKMDFSMDCGTREMYKKIKRIDAFDNVIENIKKYLSCSKTAQYSIIAKYIILNNINDNIEELDKWLSLMNDIGVKNTKLELDLREFDVKIQGNKETVKTKYYDMYKYYLKKIYEYEMNDESTPYTKLVLKEGKTPNGY